jgi:hypothetical protein
MEQRAGLMLDRLMSWTAFNAAFAVASVLGVALAAIGGKYLPNDDGRSIPLATAKIMLAERVWQAHADQAEPCIAFLGDSRTAFQVNSADFSTPGCRAGNYAFPGLYTKTIDSVARGIGRPKLIVFSYSESIFHPQQDTWKDRLLSWSLPRSVYLSLARTSAAVSAIFSEKTKPSDGWSWNAALGRWIYDGVDKRQLASLPSRDAELTAMAKSYFVEVERDPALQERVTAFFVGLASRSERLAIVIPPSMPGYSEASEILAPGEQAAYLEAARSAARTLGLPLLDCASASTCGLDASDFADPLHMNDKGAAKWTASIKERLKVQDIVGSPARAIIVP